MIPKESVYFLLNGNVISPEKTVSSYMMKSTKRLNVLVNAIIKENENIVNENTNKNRQNKIKEEISFRNNKEKNIKYHCFEIMKRIRNEIVKIKKIFNDNKKKIINVSSLQFSDGKYTGQIVNGKNEQNEERMKKISFLIKKFKQTLWKNKADFSCIKIKMNNIMVYYFNNL